MYLGGWEVKVAFNPVHCELHCSYRRTREDSLLKPVTSIRIYSGLATLFFDGLYPIYSRPVRIL